MKYVCFVLKGDHAAAHFLQRRSSSRQSAARPGSAVWNSYSVTHSFQDVLGLKYTHYEPVSWLRTDSSADL